MSKERKLNLCSLWSSVVLVVLVYLYSEFFCGSAEQCYDLETKYLEPLFICALGLVPSLLILLWRDEVFMSWLKHIAWWFLLLTWYQIAFISPLGGGGILSVSRQDMAIYSMSILFVMTLVYALVMKRKLKDIS